MRKCEVTCNRETFSLADGVMEKYSTSSSAIIRAQECGTGICFM